MTDSFNQDLLAQALELAMLGKNRPKQASLRRSISSSYYSLFHAITLEWSKNFRQPVRSSARRMIDHGKARSGCRTLSKGSSALKHMPGIDCPKDLCDVATDFERLQIARHKADYDFGVTFLRQDSIEMHSRAKRSIAKLKACRKSCPEELQAFLLELLQVRSS